MTDLETALLTALKTWEKDTGLTADPVSFMAGFQDGYAAARADLHQHGVECYSNYNVPGDPQCGFDFIVGWVKEAH